MPVSTRTSPGSPPAAAEKSKRSVTTRGHWGATSGREHVDSASSFERYELAVPFLCEGDDEQERLFCFLSPSPMVLPASLYRRWMTWVVGLAWVPR
jgi:hypothetical protein